MLRQFRIVMYRVSLNSKLLIYSNDGQRLVPAQAVIYCRGENGHILTLYFLNKARDPYGRGRLWKVLREFMLYLLNRGRERRITDSDKYPSTTEIKKDSNHEDRIRAEMFVPAQQYVWYLDLLRNEDPVAAQISLENPALNNIHIGVEPVGEGEL